MANKYARGNYLIYIFDAYGTRKKELDFTAVNYTEALERSKTLINKGESYVIMRIINNSKDNRNNWEPNVRTTPTD